MDSVSNPWQGQTSHIEFTGANGTFRRIVVNGAFLELITFGFYRFWLATQMRRYLWGSTRIDGDNLEYTGRGKELLFGFMFAMAILGPLFIAYTLIGLEFERMKAFASIPLYLFLYVFGQFAVYRARRYRLTRTVWRGIRFWMTGSGWAYAGRSILWALLLIPTLGFAYPWRAAALERYKMRHTYYGNLQGRFDATGGALFRQVWWIWLLGLITLVVSIGVTPFIAVLAKTLGPGVAVLGALPFAGMIALPFLHAARIATEWRWWLGGLRFGAMKAQCDLPRSALIDVYWKLILMSVLVWTVGAILFGGLAAIVFLGPLRGVPPEMVFARTPYWAMAAFVIVYLGLLLSLGVVMRIYTLQRVWRHVASATLLENIEALSNVTAADEAANALGEGLVDGLDFAGF